MLRSLPFALLGLAAAAGFFTLGAAPTQATPRDPSPAVPVDVEAGPTASVRVDAQLERTQLLAGRQGETFARIVLKGREVPHRQERLPVSLTLIIDQSGSMSGDKITHARRAAISALEQLLPGDRATVIAFSDGARVLVEPLMIGEQSLEPARRAISALPARGGTDMSAGLHTGGAQARRIFGDGRTNRILLLSDGQPNSEAGLKEQVAALAQAGIGTTTLGVGRDYNEDLMSRLADAGLGNYYFVQSAAQMAGIFEAELKTLAAVVAKEAVVTLALPGGVVVEDVYGYDISRGQGIVAIPVGDIYSGRRADILARLRFPAAQEGRTELVAVRVTYHDALAERAQRHSQTLAAHFTRDEAAVTASAVPAVLEKSERVRTAQALQRASAAYARGDRAQAKQIAQEQKDRIARFAASAPSAYAEAAPAMAAALDSLEEGAGADVAVSTKKAKAEARSLLRR